MKTLRLLPALIMLAVALPVYAGTPIVNSARIAGPHTVVIVYSEAVNTTINDYTSFNGALSGASLAGVSGSGTNVITLTFSGVTLAGNATGGLTIASTVTSVADGSVVGSGPYNLTDGQAPLLSSFSMSSDLAGGILAQTGNTVTVTFNANEPVTNVTATIDGHSVSASGSNAGPYTASYSISSSDTQNAVPVSVLFRDTAGNQGSGSFMLGGGLGPHITSITSDATTGGALGVNGTINFILTLASPVPGAYVSGSYDGTPLTWATANGGATYTATYTVQSTSPSTSAPMQISGVTVRDPSGNVSIPASGYDIEKTVNSQSFTITEVSAVASPIASGGYAKFGFFSAQDGSITYGGSCTSPIMSAATGYNYVTFSLLPDGTYANCTVTVTNAAGYQSNTLIVPTFVVGSGGSSSSTASAQTTSATSAAYSYKFLKPLDVGSTGPDVIALQNRLTAEGVYSGPVNGKYGPLTQAAVKKYQGFHNLKQLGNVGPGTRAALNSGL